MQRREAWQYRRVKMIDYHPERPYLGMDAMERFTALSKSIAMRYGKAVKARPLSNREYQRRFDKLGPQNNMMPPPGSAVHIMPGYLVVRNLGTSRQYETWMPDHVFEEIYKQV